MFEMKDVIYAKEVLGIEFNYYTEEEFLDGMNIELEHGMKNYLTNVTNDDVVTTAKIVLAHLNEYPNYYNKTYGLRAFERYLKSKL